MLAQSSFSLSSPGYIIKYNIHLPYDPSTLSSYVGTERERERANLNTKRAIFLMIVTHNDTINEKKK
jgi:hypothetical protein